MIRRSLTNFLNIILLLVLALISNTLTQPARGAETYQEKIGSETSHRINTPLMTPNSAPQQDLVASTVSNSTIYLPLAQKNYQTLSLSANVPGIMLWLDPGITVTKGQTLTVSATGTVYTIAGSEDSKSGPEGQLYPCPDFINSPTDCALNGAPYGALIGRIGQDGTPFKIGAYLEIPASSTGNLYLVVNDNLIYYSDNAGSYDVYITLR